MKNVISSTGNNRVRELIQLQKKAKERNNRDIFIVEGPKMFGEIPSDRLQESFASESFFEKNPALFKDREEPVLLSDHVFEYVSDTKNPQGVLALVRQYHYTLKDLLGTGKTSRPALIMILENLQDPGNLGTILRTAEGAGVTGILLSSTCVNLYNPKVIRSTMGSIYRMPFVYTNDLHADMKWLQAQGIRLYAAHLQGSVSYAEPDYKKASAFIIGNESKGLTSETAMLSDQRIHIPMQGQVESLNAAVASSILMYEAARQRM